MKTYREFAPSTFDSKGLGLSERQDWLVVQVYRNRDSDALARSNFRVTERMLTEVDAEGINHECHRFGHWANGWFEILIVRPGSAAASKAENIEHRIENYPILDEEDYSELEFTEANEVWKNCYSDSQRIEYIRDNRSQFEFRSFSDMLSCVRGNYFAGYASELLS